jgi:hypothetical protein
MKTFSHSVYRAVFSDDDEVTYYPINENAPLKKVGFVVVESISEMITLKSKGVNFICLDEDLDYDFTIYQFLSPFLMLSGPVSDWLIPEYFLTVLDRAISKSYRMKIRFNLGVDFRFANDEGDD